MNSDLTHRQTKIDLFNLFYKVLLKTGPGYLLSLTLSTVKNTCLFNESNFDSARKRLKGVKRKNSEHIKLAKIESEEINQYIYILFLARFTVKIKKLNNVVPIGWSITSDNIKNKLIVLRRDIPIC